MNKRVVAGIVAGMVGLLGAAVLVVPGIATGQSGGNGQLSTAVTPTTTHAFVAHMTGTAEVPPADPDGSGTAAVTIDTATGDICWNISYTNLDPVILQHIHEAPVGVNGPVLVNLFPTPFTPPPPLTGCVNDPVNAPRIVANPSGFYVNVHTTAFTGGAIRGQLVSAEQSTVLSPIPLRAYDSRTGGGKLQAGETRTIPLTMGKDAAGTSRLAVPPGASAALVTLTITQTVGAGYVTLYSAALGEVPATSSINWSSPEQILSVSTPVAIDGQGQVKITGGVAATNVVIDVVGYISS